MNRLIEVMKLFKPGCGGDGYGTNGLGDVYESGEDGETVGEEIVDRDKAARDERISRDEIIGMISLRCLLFINFFGTYSYIFLFVLGYLTTFLFCD